MSLKFQYKGVNKKIVVSSINTYAMFLEKVKKAFNELPKDARFFFMGQGEKISINDEASLLKLKTDGAGCKVLIVDEEEEEFIEESNASILTEIIDNEPIKEPEIVKPAVVVAKPEIAKQPEIVKKTEIVKQAELKRLPELNKQPQMKKKVVDPATMKSINYLDVIYNMFGKDARQEDKDNEMRPWIKLENLFLEDPITISQVWRASEHLIKQICEDNQ